MLLSTRPPTPRRGLSLLEVLVALTIFLLSFVAIGRLVTLASDHALEIQQHSQATRLAQSKLNEVLCGALALQSAEGSFDEDPDWQWSVDAEQDSGVSGLWTVTVTVTRPGSQPEVSALVSQMVLDPSLRGSVFDQTSVTGANDTAPSTSGATPAQGSSGAGGQSAGGAGMAGGAAAGATKGGPTRGGGAAAGRSGGGAPVPGAGRSGGGTPAPGAGRSGGGAPAPGAGRSGGGASAPGAGRGGGGGGAGAGRG